MTLTDFFTAIAQLSGLLFIVTSMLAMGMSLTVPMIRQPLRQIENGRCACVTAGASNNSRKSC